MEKELEYLGRVISNPEHPFVAILGGAKVSDKIPVMNALIDRNVNKLLIGGAMAYTFLKAEGFTVGKSLVENDKLETALQIEKRCAEAGVELLLPTDHQVVDSYEPIKGQQVAAKTIPIEFTNAGHVGMDIGIETVAHFANALKDARTIIWNGPMGVFEEPPFDQGTIGVARAARHDERHDGLPLSGLQPGDRILMVNGVPVSKWEDLVQTIHRHVNTPLQLRAQPGHFAGDGRDQPRSRRAVRCSRAGLAVHEVTRGQVGQVQDPGEVTGEHALLRLNRVEPERMGGE